MKNNRNGQASVLSEEHLESIFTVMGFRDRLLFAICYYTSCRISEALQLQRGDLINDRIVFRAATTKTKKTREVKISEKLKAIIDASELPKSGYLFTGKNGGHLTRQNADYILRKACDYLGLKGVSTHSFRRTAITKLHDLGVPLKTLQQRTGHASLSNLALYIEVSQDNVDAVGELL